MNIYEDEQEENSHQEHFHVGIFLFHIIKKNQLKSQHNIQQCDSEGIRQIIRSRGDTSSFHHLFHKIVDFDQNQSIKDKLCEIKLFRKLLENLDENSLEEFLSSVSHEQIPQFETVYKQAELPRKFYMILSGTLVSLKNKDSVVGYYDKVASKRSRLMEKRFSNYDKNNIVIHQNDPIKTVESINSNKNIQRILQPGNYFGDIELLLGVERISTIIAATDTQLISISSRVFEKVFLNFFQTQWSPILKFFFDIPFFSNMRIEQYVGIIMELKYLNLSAGNHVYLEGDIADQIYFIKYGEIQLEKKFVMDQTEFKQNTPFVSYSSNQFFGYMEIILNIQRNSTARVVSPKAGLFKISKQKFFDNLANFKAFDEMKQQAQVLFDSHQERFCKIQKECEADQIEGPSEQNTSSNIQNKSISINMGNLSSHKEFAQYKLLEQVAEVGSQRVRQAFSFQQGIQVNVSNAKNKKVVLRKNHSTQIQVLRGIGSNLEEPIDTIQVNQKKPQSFIDQQVSINQPQSSINISKISEENDNQQEIPQKKKRVQRDNLVITLLKQKAFNSKNPKVELQKIEQAFEWATKNVLMKRNKLQKQVKIKQNTSRQDVKLLQVLNLQDVLQRSSSNTSLPLLHQTVSRRSIDHY